VALVTGRSSGIGLATAERLERVPSRISRYASFQCLLGIQRRCTEPGARPAEGFAQFRWPDGRGLSWSTCQGNPPRRGWGEL